MNSPALIKTVDITNPVIHSCEYVDWYKFAEACSIRSCKNYSPVVKTKCLAIDRKPNTNGTKVISDSELRLFKFKKKKLSTRLVSLKRKRAVDKVKAMLILHKYIEYIRTHCEDSGKLFLNPIFHEREMQYPLKISKLKFKRWMWPYLLCENKYNSFTSSKGGECAEFDLHQLLGVSEQQLETLKSATKEM